MFRIHINHEWNSNIVESVLRRRQLLIGTPYASEQEQDIISGIEMIVNFCIFYMESKMDEI